MSSLHAVNQYGPGLRLVAKNSIAEVLARLLHSFVALTCRRFQTIHIQNFDVTPRISDEALRLKLCRHW